MYKTEYYEKQILSGRKSKNCKEKSLRNQNQKRAITTPRENARFAERPHRVTILAAPKGKFGQYRHKHADIVWYHIRRLIEKANMM